MPGHEPKRGPRSHEISYDIIMATFFHLPESHTSPSPIKSLGPGSSRIFEECVEECTRFGDSRTFSDL